MMIGLGLAGISSTVSYILMPSSEDFVAALLIAVGNVQVTDEPYYPRTVSPPSSPSDYSYDFHYDVRNRDRGCQLTRKVNRGARFDEWTGYDVVHIIPREHYFRIIGNTIDPVRNGILMCSHIHKQFVQYQFSINPDVCLLTPHYAILPLAYSQRLSSSLSSC